MRSAVSVLGAWLDERGLRLDQLHPAHVAADIDPMATSRVTKAAPACSQPRSSST